MKKYILVVLGVFLCVSGAVAEDVESVSFNPARLGRFERLKVSDKLSTGGPLQTDAVTINGNSSGVTIDNAGNYIITTTKANSMVELPNATLTPKTLNLYGGTAAFSAASEVETMEQSGNVPANVKAATLAMTGHAVTITGSGTDYSGNSVRGLKLGSNDIPVPGTECKGGLKWVDLSTTDHHKYSVLGCGSNTTTPSNPTPCTGESSRKCGCYNDGTQTRTCDTSTGKWGSWGACSTQDSNCCSIREYKLANKATCCQGTKDSDTDCWQYRWVETYYKDWGQCYTTQPDTYDCVISGVRESWIADVNNRKSMPDCTADTRDSYCNIHICNGPEEDSTMTCQLVKKGW